MMNKITEITVEKNVSVPTEEVWNFWTTPEHITKWSHASDDWHTTKAENDLQNGGKFTSRMEAKDGSMGFDFSGFYDEVIPNKRITYTLEDGRKVDIIFQENGEETHIRQTFEAENENPIEMQRDGWQAILDSFKKYAEGQIRNQN